MRSRLRTTAVAAAFAAAALAAALPAPARGQGYSGLLGLRYDRLQEWKPGGEYQLAPRLQFDGAATAEGFVSSPDLLHWFGNLSYNSFRDGEQLGNTSNALGFGGALDLFRSPVAVTPITVMATRTNIDHSLQLTTGDHATGTTTSTTYGGSTALNLPQRPFIRAGASRTQDENNGLGRPPTQETTDRVSAGLRHGPGPYDVDAAYDGTFRTGTLAISNFDEHFVRVNGNAVVGPHVSAYVSDVYQKRTATSIDPFNPTSENNSLSAGVRGTDPANSYNWYVSYDYTHFFVESPTVERTEQLTHAVTARSERQLSPTIRVIGFGTLNAAQVRVGDAEQVGAGQSLGALGRWTGQVSTYSMLEVEAGPTVGVLEPIGGSAQFAYGAQGRGRWTVSRGWTSAVQYDVEYAQNLEALAGWSLAQHLRGDITGLLTSTLRGSAFLSVGGSRVHNDLAGDTLTQALQAEGTLSWRRYALQAGVLYGFAPTVFSNGTFSDGLFIPAKYSGTSKSAYVSLSAALTSRLTFQIGSRYGEASGAGIPAQKEVGAFGVLTYSLGLLSLSIDDRYAAGGATSFDSRSNALFLRLARSFYGGW